MDVLQFQDDFDVLWICRGFPFHLLPFLMIFLWTFPTELGHVINHLSLRKEKYGLNLKDSLDVSTLAFSRSQIILCKGTNSRKSDFNSFPFIS